MAVSSLSSPKFFVSFATVQWYEDDALIEGYHVLDCNKWIRYVPQHGAVKEPLSADDFFSAKIILVWKDQGCGSGVLDGVNRGVDVVSRLVFYTMVAMRDEVCEDQ